MHYAFSYNILLVILEIFKFCEIILLHSFGAGQEPIYLCTCVVKISGWHLLYI